MIILIDDNKYPTEYYVEELEAEGFSTKRLVDPDTAIEFVEELVNSRSAPQVIVLDIMMPPGKRYQYTDTADGLRTGVALYHDLYRLCSEVPFIVLTNVKNEQDLKRDLGQEGPLLKVAQKLDVLPDKLVELIRKMIKESSNPAADGTSSGGETSYGSSD